MTRMIEVRNGARLLCSQGTSPGTLKVFSVGKDDAQATIRDVHVGLNIPSFGLCWSAANPSVASRTAEAHGLIRPAGCVPRIVDFWRPPQDRGAAEVRIRGATALDHTSTCACAWGGRIQILEPNARRRAAPGPTS